jgi:hypothetical protein
MKVSELIEKLQGYDPEMEVYTSDREDLPAELSFEISEVSERPFCPNFLEFHYAFRTTNINKREALIL